MYVTMGRPDDLRTSLFRLGWFFCNSKFNQVRVDPHLDFLRQDPLGVEQSYKRANCSPACRNGYLVGFDRVSVLYSVRVLHTRSLAIVFLQFRIVLVLTNIQYVVRIIIVVIHWSGPVATADSDDFAGRQIVQSSMLGLSG